MTAIHGGLIAPIDATHGTCATETETRAARVSRATLDHPSYAASVSDVPATSDSSPQDPRESPATARVRSAYVVKYVATPERGAALTVEMSAH
jgi:hypothetical protein